RKDYEHAVDMFTLLQQVRPLDPASWKGLAGIYLERGDDPGALTQLLELARTNDRDPDIPAKIARIYRRQGRNRESQYWYGRGLNIAPFHVELRKGLAETCMQAGDTAAALREYIMLTRLEPDQAKHYENAALAAYKLGNQDQAQAFARQALTLDPASGARVLLP
ncbi:MAG: tetratricopeptide repeat protein, partial [Planctomycetes bacterium]|nr:tetratricopeptide repeat protein [Planctomycetota bacterium]